MTRRLFIADSYESRALVGAAAAASAGDAVDVLLLGLSPAWLRWQHPARAEALRSCAMVDPARFADAVRSQVRRFVVDFIGALPEIDLGGGETLARLLRDPEGSVWWYLETSEKGPYRGPLIGQLHALAMARAAIDAGGYEEVAHSVRDPLLRAALQSSDGSGRLVDLGIDGTPARHGNALHDRPLLRYLVNTVLASARLFAAWSLPRAPDGRAGIARRRRVVFTVFPGWWTSATRPAARERFFAAANEAHIAGYLAWVTSPGDLRRNRAGVAAVAARHRILFLQHFLGLADLAAVWSPRRFRRLRAFERLRSRIRVRFAGFEAGPLVVRDIARSLSGNETFQDLLLRRAVARATAALAPSAILYRAEFQPLENAMLRGSAGRATRLGFVHFPFGENYLSAQFGVDEVERHSRLSGDPDARPMPDGLLAGGEAMAEHLTATGFPRSRIEVCGPLRYDSLMAYRQTQLPKMTLRRRLQLPSDSTIIIVALAIVEADTEALFGAMMEALEGHTRDVRIVVRTHPNRPAGDPALATTIATLGADRASVMPDDGALYDYIAAADAMVCIGSMIAFEAMALGVMPIVFDNPGTFGAVSLAEYNEALFSVRTGAELRDAIWHVVGDDEVAAGKREAWPRQLSRVFGDLDRPAADQFTRALDTLSCRQRQQ